ncbi:hypothetical protein INR49_012153 [Caranx melampygus]|nr:hypothetical protein INR49_012153 [Caranx melampygus]
MDQLSGPWHDPMDDARLAGRGMCVTTDHRRRGGPQQSNRISSESSNPLLSCPAPDRKVAVTGAPVAVVTLRRVLPGELVAGLRRAAAVILVRLIPSVSRVCSRAFSGTAKASSFFSPLAM